MYEISQCKFFIVYLLITTHLLMLRNLLDVMCCNVGLNIFAKKQLISNEMVLQFKLISEKFVDV